VLLKRFAKGNGKEIEYYDGTLYTTGMIKWSYGGRCKWMEKEYNG